MSISLNGVALSGSLVWSDQYKYSPVAQTVKSTLAGGVVVFAQSLSAGRNITLEATEDSGWITKAMFDSLDAMAKVPGAVYTLSYHGATYSVVFRHNEPPALDMRLLQQKANPQAGDFFIGTIKLLTV